MKAGGRRRFIVPPDLGPPVGPSTFFSAKQCEVSGWRLGTLRCGWIGVPALAARRAIVVAQLVMHVSAGGCLVHALPAVSCSEWRCDSYWRGSLLLGAGLRRRAAEYPDVPTAPSNDV